MRIADLLGLALSALKRSTDRLLFLGRHCNAHVLLFKFGIFLPSFFRLELVVGHDDKFLGRDRARYHVNAELRVGFVLQVLVQRPQLRLVLLRSFGLVDIICGEFDLASYLEDIVGY